jgi:hypothetical protein
MSLRRGVVVAALLGVSIAVLVGCGSASGGPAAPAPTTALTTPVNDPTLLDAADTVVPMLEKSFPDTYAGLALDHQQHVMTIYRRPDPALDAAVRARIPQVRVAFRDARFSLPQLRQLRDHIVADTAYWSGRGVSIQTVGAMVDGSGVGVGTLRGAPEEAALLSQRYGTETVTVEKISVVPAG